MNKYRLSMLICTVCASLAGCDRLEQGDSIAVDAVEYTAASACSAPGDAPVRIAGGTFLMGDDSVYAEEGPVRETTVDGFWIDPHEVTNRQFAEFVSATGHVTIAEQPIDPALFGVPVERIPPELLLPGSAVFTPPDAQSGDFNNWWAYLPGANWKKPYGPAGPDAKPEQPVVHLGWDDMFAYAEWKGGRMPTEAEWEFAATGGERAGIAQPDPEAANTWQGVFPARNSAADGFEDIAPAGCFAPNANGLYDMVGNVWEVTADFYRPGHDPEDTHNPLGPHENDAYDPLNPDFPSRVMKGGSFLCAPNYCMRYRPAARQGSDPGLGSSNVGFRLVYDTLPNAD